MPVQYRYRKLFYLLHPIHRFIFLHQCIHTIELLFIVMVNKTQIFKFSFYKFSFYEFIYFGWQNLGSVHSQIQHLIHSLKISPFSALLFKDDLFFYCGIKRNYFKYSTFHNSVRFQLLILKLNACYPIF